MKAWICVVGLLSGCASRASSDFVFPETFSAQQIVSVRLQGHARAKERTETFVAVLRRSPVSTRVDLLDPLFLVPFVSVEKDGAGTRTHWSVPEPEGIRGHDLPSKLMALLDDLYGAAAWRHADAPAGPESSMERGPLRAESFFYDAVLSNVSSHPSSSCPFPKVISVYPKRGEAREVRVETNSVSCDPNRGTL